METGRGSSCTCVFLFIFSYFTCVCPSREVFVDFCVYFSWFLRPLILLYLRDLCILMYGLLYFSSDSYLILNINNTELFIHISGVYTMFSYVGSSFLISKIMA